MRVVHATQSQATAKPCVPRSDFLHLIHIHVHAMPGGSLPSPRMPRACHGRQAIPFDHRQKWNEFAQSGGVAGSIHSPSTLRCPCTCAGILDGSRYTSYSSMSQSQCISGSGPVHRVLEFLVSFGRRRLFLSASAVAVSRQLRPSLRVSRQLRPSPSLRILVSWATTLLAPSTLSISSDIKALMMAIKQHIYKGREGRSPSQCSSRTPCHRKLCQMP